MNEKKNLISFLNSMKKTLPFKDEDEFKRKITENKEFRIRVQKLVYLSKFFGWENRYHFNFHEHGPYSCQLSEDYSDVSLNTSIPELNMDHEGLREFVKNQNNESLESSSTILYLLSKNDLKIDNDEIPIILSYLKPHIPKNTIEQSFKRIKEYDLMNHELSHQICMNKNIVLDKIDGLINIFKNFETCSNQMLILGSLDYFRLALKRENIEFEKKKELLQVVYDYGEYVEDYYFNNYSMRDNFPYYDLKEIDDRFIELQDYISNLNILPRLYDENVDLSIFLE